MSTLHELESKHGRDLAQHDYWAQARASIILDWVDARQPDTLADIGCGSGYLTAAIADRGHEAVGLDIDPSLIEMAQNRDTPATFRVGDARDLPWDTGRFDCLIYADVLEHFSDPAPLLREGRRVLAPHGEVIVSLPALRVLFGPHDDNQDHWDRYNRRRLRWLADRTGFTVAESRYTNAIPLLPYLVTQRVLKTDVPTAARGESRGVIEWVKSKLLSIEQSTSPPIGVTLLARLQPKQTMSRERRVVLMNYEYPPECGGGGVFTQKLYHHLGARGHDIDLVIGNAASATQSNSVADLVQFPIRSLPELLRSVRDSDTDLINAHFALPTAAALPAIKASTGIPYVVSLMGADVHDPTRYHRLRPVMDVLNKWAVFRHADRVIAPSTDMRDRLPAGIQLKTDIVPFFIDASRFHAPTVHEPHDPLRLLTVARLVPRKNLLRVMDAVAAVANERPVEYTIVGSGSQLDVLKAEAERFGIADRVTFCGHVPNEEIQRVYQTHDMFVLPSKHEGFGIVYLEALASGLPVVAADVGGQTDIVTEQVGRCVPPTETGEIALAIREIHDDYASFARHARDRVVENFTAEQVIPEYERIYAEVSDGSA